MEKGIGEYVCVASSINEEVSIIMLCPEEFKLRLQTRAWWSSNSSFLLNDHSEQKYVYIKIEWKTKYKKMVLFVV